MDIDLRDSMKESQRRKRVAEYLDKLMKERNIRIEEIDSTMWHQLVRDAENLVKNDERI
jgi:septal ring factor EnvC (AmiA/AmiB activator)